MGRKGRTYRFFHVEDSSRYLVDSDADPDGGGNWPQSLWSSKLGNLQRRTHWSWNRKDIAIKGKATFRGHVLLATYHQRVQQKDTCVCVARERSKHMCTVRKMLHLELHCLLRQPLATHGLSSWDTANESWSVLCVTYTLVAKFQNKKGNMK